MNVPQVDELREVADWLRAQGKSDNAKFIDGAAQSLQAAGDFFAWFNKSYPQPSSNELHPWSRLGVALAVGVLGTFNDQQEADHG